MINANRLSTSFLTEVDPRLKLVSALALIIMAIASGRLSFLLIVGASSVIFSLLAGIRLRSLLLRFLQPAFIAAVIFILKLFLVGESQLFSIRIGPLHLVAHTEGLAQGLITGGRILAAVSVVALLTLTTSFTDLMGALSWLRVPATIVEISLFAWRYLFLLFDDAQVIYNAQKNRLGYAGYGRGLRSFGTLAGTLVIKAFDSSQSMTTAMVQRGYDGSMPTLKHRPFRVVETLACVSVITIIGVIWKIT